MENQAQKLKYFAITQMTRGRSIIWLQLSFLYMTLNSWGLPKLDKLSSNECINFLQTFCLLQAGPQKNELVGILVL